MKRNLFVSLSLMLALLLCSCAGTQSNAKDNSQKSQIEKFLRLIYSTSGENSSENSSDSVAALKNITTKNSYQNLAASGAIFIATTCERDFSCKLSIKNIIVTAESDVENAFAFVVETSAEFANSSISDYLQHGQVTVLEEKGIWLVDNFYENQPDLYNQISNDVTPTAA